MNDFKMTSACDPHGLLACKIVQQAVIDWRKLNRGEDAGVKTSKEEIRRFLLSVWCEELLAGTGIDGEWVLNKLEEELEQEGEPECGKKSAKKLLTIDGRTATVHAWCKELRLDNGMVYKWYNRQGRRYTERRMAEIKRERGL